jgi:hypothetical protein
MQRYNGASWSNKVAVNIGIENVRYYVLIVVIFDVFIMNTGVHAFLFVDVSLVSNNVRTREELNTGATRFQNYLWYARYVLGHPLN